MPNNFQLDDPQLLKPVSVRRHPVDRDRHDFDVVTGERVEAWTRRLSRGCWFLNPRFTVYSESPSVSFFRRVREVQGSWLRTARQRIHNRGVRRKARKLEALGRQLAFSGILVFDGQIIPPRTWNRQADKLLKPFDFQIVETHRRLDLAALKATADLASLKVLAQSALQAHVDEHPGSVALILPNLTVTSPVITPAFDQRVEQATKQWSHLLKRTLGKDGFRDALKVADTETEALVFSGVLYADGQLHRPACRPNLNPEQPIPEPSPSLSPTVVACLLGLKPIPSCLAQARSRPPSIETPKLGRTDNSAVNEKFKALFGTASP